MFAGKSARAVAVAAFLFVAVLQLHELDDGDTWWHLASGRLIVGGRTIPSTDPFSFTAPGAPWINRQWLFDVAAYGAWRVAGAAGAILLAGVGFLAGLAASFLLARRYLPVWAAAVLLFLATSCAVERFTVRPEALTFCFLAIYLLVLDRRPLRAAGLVGLVVLQVLWANVHALSILGVVAIAAELIGAAAGRWLPLPGGWQAASRRDPRTLVWLAVTAAYALAAEAATPFGVPGALFPLRLLGVLRGQEVTSRSIVEHRPTVIAELSPEAAFGFLALLALAAVAAAVSWRRWRLSHVLLAVAFIGLGFLARRNVALVGIGVVPLIAAGLAPVVAAAERRLVVRPLLATTLAVALVLGFIGAAASVVTGHYYDAARLTRRFGLGESRLLFPSRAIEFLDAQPETDRVFNDDALGGYLLWRTYPRRRVFIDGRLQVYPAAVYAAYQTVLDDPARFAELAARTGITAAILYHPAPGRLELARAIAAVPDWRIAYLDGGAVVLLADGKTGAPLAGVTGPAIPREASVPGRLLAAVRPPIEDAIAYYQRGRALLYLLGPAGTALARADFEAALHAWPAFDEARVGLAATRNVRPAQ